MYSHGHETSNRLVFVKFTGLIQCYCDDFAQMRFARFDAGFACDRNSGTLSAK